MVLTNSHTLSLVLLQQFLMSFTDDNLIKGFLDEPVRVVVNCTTSFLTMYVTMNYNENSGKAEISTGWRDTVLILKQKKNDICVFSFWDERNLPRRDRSAWLRLVIYST